MNEIVRPPEEVLKILRTLKVNGYDAYAVGGCVRDSVLERTPKDWDIATNASPEKTIALFEKTISTGIKHGTVTVMINGKAFEVTAFRIDGKYEDGRHPSYIKLTGQVEEDLRRRDFTMNAMAWNNERGIVDPFGGIVDIRSGLIRAVGEPDERFKEDALRMLRAVRFAAGLGFEIHADTLRAIGENSRLIERVSNERIRDELTGILTGKEPMKFALLRETGLLKLILPEVEACFSTPQHNPHHIYNVGEHSLRATAAIESEKCLRWTMLLHDTGKVVTRTTDEKGIDHYYGHPAKSVEIAGNILKRLRFDNRSIEKILRLIKSHDREIILKEKAVAKAVHAVGEDIFPDLLKVKRADKAAQNPIDMEKGIEYVNQIERMYEDLKAKNSCLEQKDLAINGKELIKIGFKEGREVGCILNLLFEKVQDNQVPNEKLLLTEFAAGLLEKNEK